MPDKFQLSIWDDICVKICEKSIGRYIGETIGRTYESVGIKEQGYNPTMAVLWLSNKVCVQEKTETGC